MLLTFIAYASLDCPDIINLAYGMNMHLVQPAKWYNLTNYDCFDFKSNGLYCSIYNRVTSLTWSTLKLNGTLNISAIPPYLGFIEITTNKLYGEIPFIPETVTTFRVMGNFFSGSLPSYSSVATGLDFRCNSFNGTLEFKNDSKLITLYVDGNKLTGEIPQLPNTIKVLSIDSNQFSGTIPMLPKNMTTLEIGRNLLTGHLPDIPSTMKQLSTTENMLYGPIPILPMTMTELFLGSNNFSGCVPLMPFKVTNLVLRGNMHLQGFITITETYQVDISFTQISQFTIINNFYLQFCDLSSTPLLGKVDSYSGCYRRDLYTLEGSCALNTTLNTATAIVSASSNSSSSSALFDTPSTVAISDTPLSSSYESTALRVTRLTRKPSFAIISSTLHSSGTSTQSTLLKSSTLATLYDIYIQNNQNVLSFPEIKLSLFLVIKVLLNWGILVYALSELKRNRSAIKHKQAMSLSDIW